MLRPKTYLGSLSFRAQIRYVMVIEHYEIHIRKIPKHTRMKYIVKYAENVTSLQVGVTLIDFKSRVVNTVGTGPNKNQSRFCQSSFTFAASS